MLGLARVKSLITYKKKLSCPSFQYQGEKSVEMIEQWYWDVLKTRGGTHSRPSVKQYDEAWMRKLGFWSF